MINQISSRRRLDWRILEKLVTEVTLRSARGEARLLAVARSLEISASPLSCLANPLCFQTEDYALSVSKQVLDINDPEFRTVCRSFLPLLLVQKDGRCHLRSAGESLNEVISTSRWVSQHLMQAKGQSLFLLFFVPVVSFLFVVSSWHRFVANIAESSGLVCLLAAFGFYAAGCAFLGVLFGRQKRILANGSLFRTAGQAALLRELAAAGQTPGASLSSLSQALASGTSSSAKQWSQWFLFALAHPLQCQGQAPTRSGNSELEFISQLRDGYLRVAPRVRTKWLTQTHNALNQSLKREAAVETAKLSLWLLLVMAIFFLPALFLMLSLSGMNFGPGTIG